MAFGDEFISMFNPEGGYDGGSSSWDSPIQSPQSFDYGNLPGSGFMNPQSYSPQNQDLGYLGNYANSMPQGTSDSGSSGWDWTRGGQTQTPFGMVNVPGIGAIGGGLAQFLMNNRNASQNNALAARTAQMQDPFGSQRQIYQGELQRMMTDPNYMRSIPGYQGAFDQGMEAVRRNAAKFGRLDSGNLNYDLQDYGRNFALNQFNNQQQTLGQLGGAGFNGGSGAASALQAAQEAGQKQQAYGLQALVDPWKQASANATLGTNVANYGKTL